MHPCAHVASTGFIVISHALSLNIDKIVMIYYLITYTFIDTIFIFDNIRRDSLIIHHLVTLKLLLGALHNVDLIPMFVPLGMLEWTTFFNSLNQLLRNDITLICRNTSWVLVRMIYLPFITYQILLALEVKDINYSYCVLTLLILSYEWSLELLKVEFKFLSGSYYLIPALYLQSCYLEYAIISLVMAIFSKVYIYRYEPRLIFNLGMASIMQRVYL